MSTMSMVGGKVFAFLSRWPTPQTLVIIDFRLGALFWTLRVGVVCYILYEVWGGKQYRLVDVPIGYPTFWFEAGKLFDAQNSSAVFCDNPDYDYWYVNDSESFWVEQGAGCFAPQPGEIAKKMPQSAFVTTYLKQLHSRTQACSTATACEAVGGELMGRDHHDMIISNPSGQRSCTCGKLSDYYLLGADSLQLFVDHSFESRTSAWSVTGTSKREEPSELEKSIKTCVKKCGKRNVKTGKRHCEDGCHLSVEPGQTINLSVAEWLSLAGYSLDERLEGQVKKSERDDQHPFRRLVGTNMNLRLTYEGDVNQDSTFKCNIEVDVVDGWTNLGSEVTYASYSGPSGDNELYDHFRRGVLVQFFPSGQVYRFDFFTLVQTIITGLVMLGVVDTVTGLVAFYCLGESSIYSAAVYETLMPSRRLAKFGLNAALICQLFDMLNQQDKDHKISEAELKRAFVGKFSDEEAEKLSRAILSEARRSGTLKESDNELTVQGLVELMTTDEVTLDDLRKHADAAEETSCLPVWAIRGAPTGSTNERANSVVGV